MTHFGEDRAYIVVTPMRNEIATVATTLKSMIGQTEKPILWLIIDDGSVDGCDGVVKDHHDSNPWIRLLKRSDRGFDFVGQGVAELLNFALREIRALPSRYVAKLDADLELPPDYFEVLLDFMEATPSAGTVSGHPYCMEGGEKLPERHSDQFPSGTARLYRRAFLDEIGGFVNSVGWDTVDIVRMNLRGYDTRVLHELPFHHMRRMGTRNGYVDGIVRDGRNAYLTGYTPWFIALRALFNMRYKPYAVRTVCMLWGYGSACWSRLPRVVTPEELAFHVSWQRKRIRLLIAGRTRRARW